MPGLVPGIHVFTTAERKTWMGGGREAPEGRECAHNPAPPPAMTESIRPMTPRTATLVGLTAILMWSLLSVLTVATGKIPAFQLAAMTFAIGAAVAFASFIWRPAAFAALKQPLAAWVVGV